MTVLVTGASGMLGANLCRQLVERGHDVRTYTRREIRNPVLAGVPVSQFHGDLEDALGLRLAMAGCSDVFHVAGRISYFDADEGELFRTNVLGTRNVLSAAAVNNVRRVVVTSSTAALAHETLADSAELGTAACPPPHAFAYGATKAFAEQEAFSWSGAVDVIVVNPATIYGAGDIYRNTGEVFRRIRHRSMWICPPGGTSIVSVADCVAGHLLAWERGRRGERYILATSDHSYKELFQGIADAVKGTAPSLTMPPFAGGMAYAGGWAAETLGRLFGGRSFSRHFVKLGFSNRYYSAAKARREIGWVPRQSLTETLAEAANFYFQHNLI